jgi:hypothetical protein
MMPTQIKQAIQWAFEEFEEMDKCSEHMLVDKVREYFNENNIEYGTFSYDDLVPYLPE